MSSGTLRVQKISGHAGPVPGQGTQRQQTVAKLTKTVANQAAELVELRHLVTNLALANAVLRATPGSPGTLEGARQRAAEAAGSNDVDEGIADEIPNNVIRLPVPMT